MLILISVPIYSRGNLNLVWTIKKQQTVSTSSSEAGYISMALGCFVVMGIRSCFIKLGFNADYPIPIYEDNQTCIVKGESEDERFLMRIIKV
ncbi:hypothetical protein BLOT_004399 [Blomia tropicalis]|nr:hypothetical protein BLOT_004399 [Blomia tropicalis]